MSAHPTIVRRLYLMQVAQGLTPVVCYLLQTTDGKNILIDTGLPRGFQPPPDMGMPPIEHRSDVVEQLATLSLQPASIDMLICTHFDIDHAGNLQLFEQAELVVQRQHYELARGGSPRLAMTRSSWDHPGLRYRLLDGDTELLPGVELLVTDGHVRGHQSVLVSLPKMGPVLLTIDAVPARRLFTPERSAEPQDENEELARAGARKLIEAAGQARAALIIFGHDNEQWPTLKKFPAYYE